MSTRLDAVCAAVSSGSAASSSTLVGDGTSAWQGSGPREDAISWMMLPMDSSLLSILNELRFGDSINHFRGSKTTGVLNVDGHPELQVEPLSLPGVAISTSFVS